MAHHRLGHRSEAEEWFDKAMRWTNDEIPELDQDGRVSWPVSWLTRATVRLLLDEARALLSLPEVSGQPEMIPQSNGKEADPEEE